MTNTSFHIIPWTSPRCFWSRLRTCSWWVWTVFTSSAAMFSIHYSSTKFRWSFRWTRRWVRWTLAFITTMIVVVSSFHFLMIEWNFCAIMHSDCATQLLCGQCIWYYLLVLLLHMILSPSVLLHLIWSPSVFVTVLYSVILSSNFIFSRIIWEDLLLEASRRFRRDLGFGGKQFPPSEPVDHSGPLGLCV